jgi:hypothetical protein
VIEKLEIPVQNCYGGIKPEEWAKIYDKINELIAWINEVDERYRGRR